MYGAKVGRYKGKRKPFVQYLDHPEIVYEPGKCIACGICLTIAEEAREPLGLAFIGRGFQVRVGVPLGRSVAEGLRTSAKAAAEACPTGAIAVK
jgi:NADH dehydrogenase/NADH:ubiquinone oxidoreductase subunit G